MFAQPGGEEFNSAWGPKGDEEISPLWYSSSTTYKLTQFYSTFCRKVIQEQLAPTITIQKFRTTEATGSQEGERQAQTETLAYVTAAMNKVRS